MSHCMHSRCIGYVSVCMPVRHLDERKIQLSCLNIVAISYYLSGEEHINLNINFVAQRNNYTKDDNSNELQGTCMHT